MFDTLITYVVAYYQAHSEALARYRASKLMKSLSTRPISLRRGHSLHPPWNSSEMQQRLDEES